MRLLIYWYFKRPVMHLPFVLCWKVTFFREILYSLTVSHAPLFGLGAGAPISGSVCMRGNRVGLNMILCRCGCYNMWIESDIM